MVVVAVDGGRRWLTVVVYAATNIYLSTQREARTTIPFHPFAANDMHIQANVWWLDWRDREEQRERERGGASEWGWRGRGKRDGTSREGSQTNHKKGRLRDKAEPWEEREGGRQWHVIRSWNVIFTRADVNDETRVFGWSNETDDGRIVFYLFH